ncbi:MAG: hypothetical protein WC661_04775 [Opitutaceae bacterium]|jgi:hypothetical protein
MISRCFRFLAIGFVFGVFSLKAAENTPEVSNLRLRANGAFSFDGLDFALMHFSPDWAAVSQEGARPEPGYPKRGDPTWETRGALAIQGNNARLAYGERITRTDGRSFEADYQVTHSEGIQTRELALQAMLPLELGAGRSVVLDGVARELPKQSQRKTVLAEPAMRERTLLLPAATGMIEIKGVFGVLVQDNRQWKQDAYTVRLQFSLPDGPLKQAALKLGLRHIPYLSVPVSLRGAANRGFRDDVAGDLKGGWTDQGPTNDLAVFAPGTQTLAGVTFDIADPATNDGRAALVLGHSGRGGAAVSAVVPVPDRPVWRNLYLLHSGAWLPANGAAVGRLRVRYTDGTEGVQEVQAGRDLGNWWQPASLSNAVVGWRGENASSPVGLYVSRFVLEEKPVVEVALEAEGDALWMVAGMSGSPDDIAPSRSMIPLVVKAGPEWAPYAHSVEIEQGGVFDFSKLADAPAGKHGALVATPAGHFEFAGKPGARVRLWGVNLCFTANYLEHAEADRLAARLAASGYNTVRFHHYDRDLIAKGGPSHEPDPAQLDKLDYLFAAMKRHGIYVNIDLFTIRGFSKDEMAAMGIDPQADTMAQFKALVPVSEDAFAAWTRFAQSLLTHQNSYTGLTWAADPALIGICPVNEDTLTVWVNCTPEVRRRYDEAFASWWKEAGNSEKSGGDRAVGFNRFLNERQGASDARMFAFLRSIGVKAPLTGVNFVSAQGQAFLRERYDYVDNHEYWDHPSFPEKQWSLPNGFVQASAVRSAAQVPRAMMPARLWGKPYVVSEFNFVRPNQYRAEGGVLMPAYASLQDWDGLYNFDYAAKRAAALEGGADSIFSIAEDPIGLLADRVSALLFRRGDIAPGRHAIGYAVRASEVFAAQGKGFPPEFSRLGLVTRIGSGTGSAAEELARHGLDAVVGGASVSTEKPGIKIYRANEGIARRLEADGVLPPDSTDEKGSKFTSDTGQIELRQQDGAVKVVTERSELFVLPAGQLSEGARVTVKNGTTFGTVSVISLDGMPLAKSGRVLVTHLTDALATGMKFADQDRRLQVSRGGAPHLVRAGGAEIRLRLDAGKTWRAWAVDATGKRQREVGLVRDGDAWVLQAQTVTPEGTQLAYELAAK